MSVCCDCCVLSGRGLCVGLITRPEESYRLWCLVVCDLETSWMRRPWPTLGPAAPMGEMPDDSSLNRNMNQWLTNIKALCLTYLLHGAESFLRSWLVLQLIKKFSAFYGTRKFITVLTSARHLSLSWANSIHSPQPLPTSSRSILVLSYHLRLGLPNGLFPSGFPTKTLCTSLIIRPYSKTPR